MYEENVTKFICGDKNMVVVKLKNTTHVMTEEEWGGFLEEDILNVGAIEKINKNSIN